MSHIVEIKAENYQKLFMVKFYQIVRKKRKDLLRFVCVEYIKTQVANT